MWLPLAVKACFHSTVTLHRDWLIITLYSGDLQQSTTPVKVWEYKITVSYLMDKKVKGKLTDGMTPYLLGLWAPFSVAIWEDWQLRQVLCVKFWCGVTSHSHYEDVIKCCGAFVLKAGHMYSALVYLGTDVLRPALQTEVMLARKRSCVQNGWVEFLKADSAWQCTAGRTLISSWDDHKIIQRLLQHTGIMITWFVLMRGFISSLVVGL